MRSIIVTVACLIMPGSALLNGAVLVSSTFNATDEGWSSFSFAGTTDPDFSGSIGGPSAATFNAAFGNPAGSISQIDPDSGWQYFVAPAAFLGNQSAAFGSTLSFQEMRLDTLSLGASIPSALLAITDGTTVLVYQNTAAAPVVGSWTQYTVNFNTDGAGWFVGSTSGSAATGPQLQTVLSNLTNMYVPAEWFAGALSTNQPENIALDNVVLSASDVPESGTFALGLVGLLLVSIGKMKRPRR